MERGITVLRDAAGPIPQLGEVAGSYAELLTEARMIAQKINEAVAAGDEVEDKWPAAAAQASYVAALHARVAEQLVAATGD